MKRLIIDPNTKLGKMIIKYDKISEKTNFTERELDIIRLYTEHSDMFLYSAMYNYKYLNPDKYHDFKKGFNGSKELISIGKLVTLNKAIEKSKSKDELVLYRGTKNEYFKTATVINDDMVTFIAPTSTSISRAVVSDYLSKDDPLLLEIHIPLGFPALWLKPFSLYPAECEFLLKGNSNYLITKQELESKTKKIVLTGIK